MPRHWVVERQTHMEILRMFVNPPEDLFILLRSPEFSSMSPSSTSCWVRARYQWNVWLGSKVVLIGRNIVSGPTTLASWAVLHSINVVPTKKDKRIAQTFLGERKRRCGGHHATERLQRKLRMQPISIPAKELIIMNGMRVWPGLSRCKDTCSAPPALPFGSWVWTYI